MCYASCAIESAALALCHSGRLRLHIILVYFRSLRWPAPEACKPGPEHSQRTRMAPKRGMSLEDKRSTLLSIFHDTKSAFLLKDIEKMGAKRGVVLQSIKDVLQSLVDDDLVNMEKIGASNIFWSAWPPA